MGEYTENVGLSWCAVTVRLGDLQPWTRNPRRMRKEQAERLLRSWSELGQFQTIAIGPEGEVYDGHQRLSALLSAYGPDYQVQALQASRALTEAERMRLTLAANNPVGEWDWAALREWPQEVLAAEGMGQELVQALYEDARALARIWASPVEASAPEPKVEVAEELREKWGTAPRRLGLRSVPRSSGGSPTLPLAAATTTRRMSRATTRCGGAGPPTGRGIGASPPCGRRRAPGRPWGMRRLNPWAFISGHTATTMPPWSMSLLGVRGPPGWLRKPWAGLRWGLRLSPGTRRSSFSAWLIWGWSRG